MSTKFVMAGVMGWPVSHSRSPLIHNHWIQQHGLLGAYGLFPVQPANLEAALRGLAALGIAGCNITIPHKVEAMRHVDWVDPHAQRVGAINTVVVQPDGQLHGYNHDGYGFVQSLRDVQPDWRADQGPIAVLGAGGAARAILVALLAQGAKEIRLINRTLETAQALCTEFGAAIQAVDWSQRHTALADCSLLVQTTSLGMQGQAPLDLLLDDLPTSALVSDIIYVPLETALLRQARERGNLTVNGLGMLLHQARPAFASWFGVMPDVSPALYNTIIASLT